MLKIKLISTQLQKKTELKLRHELGDKNKKNQQFYMLPYPLRVKFEAELN